MVDSFRNVAGMYVTRGVEYDDFVTMRNFSGSATEKFLTMVTRPPEIKAMEEADKASNDVLRRAAVSRSALCPNQPLCAPVLCTWHSRGRVCWQQGAWLGCPLPTC